MDLVVVVDPQPPTPVATKALSSYTPDVCYYGVYWSADWCVCVCVCVCVCMPCVCVQGRIQGGMGAVAPPPPPLSPEI